jgi:hypothetical protein
MRISYVLCFLIAAFAVPAVAADADLKQQVEKIGVTYAETSINKMRQGSLHCLQLAACMSIRPGPQQMSQTDMKVFSRPDLIT